MRGGGGAGRRLWWVYNISNKYSFHVSHHENQRSVDMNTIYTYTGENRSERLDFDRETDFLFFESLKVVTKTVFT